MKTIELKTWPPFYESLFDGSKPFEVRKNDRPFEVDDVLYLREWDPNKGTEGEYTGRAHRRTITYILTHEQFQGVAEGYVVLGLDPVLVCDSCGEDNLDPNKIYREIEYCKRCFVAEQYGVQVGKEHLEAAQKHMTSMLIFNGLWKKLAKTLRQKIVAFDEACGFGDYDDGREEVPDFYKQMAARLMDIIASRDIDVSTIALASHLWHRDRKRSLQETPQTSDEDLSHLTIFELDTRVSRALSFLQIAEPIIANPAFDALYEIQKRRAEVENLRKTKAVLEARLEQESQPLQLILTCPSCNHRHIDVGEFATKVHHTHACQYCGMVWRPAVHPTIGVQFLPGFKNEE